MTDDKTLASFNSDWDLVDTEKMDAGAFLWKWECFIYQALQEADKAQQLVNSLDVIAAGGAESGVSYEYWARNLARHALVRWESE